jgi:hypothetical protein
MYSSGEQKTEENENTSQKKEQTEVNAWLIASSRCSQSL